MAEKKRVHWIVGEDAYGDLQFALPGEEIVVIRDDLSVGPLPPKADSREEFWEGVYGRNQKSDLDFLKSSKLFVDAYETLLTRSVQGHRIVFWVDPRARSWLAFWHTLTILGDGPKDWDIVRLNAPVARVAPIQLRNMEAVSIAESIHKDVLEIPWDKIPQDGFRFTAATTRSNMCTFLGKIIDVDVCGAIVCCTTVVDLDEMLLRNIGTEWLRGSSAIGATIGSGVPVGDEIVNWRLKKLCLENRLEYRGNLDEGRAYEVRIR